MWQINARVHEQGWKPEQKQKKNKIKTNSIEVLQKPKSIRSTIPVVDHMSKHSVKLRPSHELD